jgi:cell division protein ZapA
MSAKKTVVKVSIVGEEYSIRSDATPEHTRAVAEYVDKAIRAVLNAGGGVETRKAAILAALQITDELFQARRARVELAEAIQGLSADVRRWLPPAKRPVTPTSTDVFAP